MVNEDLGIVQNYYNDVLVYPNPTKDYIEVKNENSILQSYEIYNTDGKILDSKLTNSIVSKIDLSYYPTGFYILVIDF